MKKLLIIGYVWPEPKSSAAGSRMLELIELFASQQWNIIFASAAALSEHRFILSEKNIQEKIIELNNSSFDTFLESENPDAVLFDRFFTEEQFGWRVAKICPHAIRILDTEDLHGLRHARHLLLKQSQKTCTNEIERQSVPPVLASPDQLYQVMAQNDMAQREIAAIFRCDLSLIISQFEKDLLVHYFSVPPFLLCYCPFLNAVSVEKKDLPVFLHRQHFIAIGNFRHEPNWDSVLYLKHAIWPLIRTQLPDAELHVYGAYPPPKATQLHNSKQGFCVKGWADDALLVMKNARVCLAPLRFGAGIKGKLMDAMRVGTPSVTTSIGAEAMCGDLAWGGAIANSAESFAAEAVQLYTNECLWGEAQNQSKYLIDKVFGQDHYSEKLMHKIAELQENLVEWRVKNFIGSMLQHHFHKSTQYMSQWIEEKNKKKSDI